MITIRSVQFPADRGGLLRLDTSFSTDRIYRVEATPSSFTLVEELVQAPLRKAFALEGELEADRLWDEGFVAQQGEQILGFAAARHERWNRRVALWHLYVAPQQRRGGLGRQLLEAVEGYARAQRARCLWLEVSSANEPAIQFYRRIGFTLCGLDQALYDPESEAAGETALYFSRPLL